MRGENERHRDQNDDRSSRLNTRLKILAPANNPEYNSILNPKRNFYLKKDVKKFEVETEFETLF